MKKFGQICASALTLCLATTVSHAAIVYTFPLDGFQVVPPNASPGVGTATITLDTAADTLNWDLSWSGLLGTVVAIYFHGDAAVGINAPVTVNVGANSGLASPSIGGTTITDAQEASILAGLWYLTVHCDLFPGGEIRGQVVPAPGAPVLLGIAGLAAVRRRRRA